MTADGEGHHINGRKQRQVFPATLDYQGDHYFSQRLVDAAHANHLQLALEHLSNPSVDVNFIGTVCLKSRKTQVVLNGESASEVGVDFEEFRTEVTPLFLAAHNGNVSLVRKLLNLGADVKQKLFRGYATTAAVREGHIEVLELLLNGGAAHDPAVCGEALLEACYLGLARPAELLMASEMKNMIRPHVVVHALVTASSRGFVDFVHTVIKSGVDVNANARILLQSSKPSLHTNVDCNALVAAIVNRHVSLVKLLLQVGCRMDTEVRLGAWSWDATAGEEFRVGAGLAEPYSVTWCAVEYFEASGAILRMLLEHLSPNIPHLGRTILHHAILCRNARAVEVLLSCGADMEFPTETTKEMPIHLAARYGLPIILALLINAGCDLNSRTVSGETPLMICARYKQGKCLKLLASAGADFGLSNISGQCAMKIAGSVGPPLGFEQNRDEIAKIIPENASVCANTSTNKNRIISSSSASTGSARVSNPHGTEILHEDVNATVDCDRDEYTTPLLSAAAADGCTNMSCGHSPRLISIKNNNTDAMMRDGETSISGVALEVDEIARRIVTKGEHVKKHTKAGKGSPHGKVLKMVEGTGVLSWGNSRRRNVICRGAEVGASSAFRWNRRNRKRSDADEAGVFRVVTTENKEIHFCCQGNEIASLWVRGIRLLTREAIFGGCN